MASRVRHRIAREISIPADGKRAQELTAYAGGMVGAWLLASESQAPNA